jgi:hypothetical protein
MKTMAEIGYQYLGMSYESASREAARLVEEAHKTGKWFGLVEKLAQLRDIMLRHQGQSPSTPEWVRAYEMALKSDAGPAGVTHVTWPKN